MVYDPPVKTCRGCGEPFLPHEEEPRYRWKERTTCGVGCGRKVGREKGHETRSAASAWGCGMTTTQATVAASYSFPSR
jgi:hypothetical protein